MPTPTTSPNRVMIQTPTGITGADVTDAQLATIRAVLDGRPVGTVTILSDGDYTVEGGPVDVCYDLAEGDATCGCGRPIYREELDGDVPGHPTGGWLHREAPEVWGDDHDAHAC